MGKKTENGQSLRNRIVGEGMEAPADLLANPQNWRRHPREQLAALEGMLEAVGWVQRVIVNRTTGRMVDGHARVELAIKRNEAAVPVLFVELTPDEERVVLAGLDPIGGLAETDQAMLDGLLDGLTVTDPALQALLDGLGSPPKEETRGGLTDPEEVPKLPAVAASRRGDVWRLGHHLLMCGDCTDDDAVRALIGEERADLCLTDPPYGLGEKKASGKNAYAEYVDSRANLVDLARKWLPLAKSISEAVVFSPGVTNQWIYPEPTWVLCWFYGGGQLRSSWGFNCWQPFLAYGKDPSLAAGRGGRPDAVNLNIPANAGEIDHPCPKPVALWEWMLKRLVFKESALLFEPFSGSGTTLVAAQMHGHRVRAVELTPRYVDVAVRRWQAFTGLEATLEGDGRTFAEIEADRLDAEVAP